MELNLKKLDERIQKLQELRRIAADPEMIAMLFEFMATDDERPAPPPPVPAPPVRVEAVAAAAPDDADIVQQVVKGGDAQGSGLWSRKR